MDTLPLALLFVFNAVGIASAAGLFCKRDLATRKIAGTIFCLWLLAFAGFCTFGYMASFEPPFDRHRPWQIGYATAGLLALIGSALAGRRAYRKE